jgi:hypothetical protein
MAAHFRICARLDESRVQLGTVSIDRERGLFTVRPLRRRRTYTLPLDAVASMVVGRVLRAEVLEARKKKRSQGTA